MTPARRAALLVASVGLLVRLGVVAWAAGSIPPSADGTYYHALAVRLAEGQGYTWLWPDGAVTYAAHYPVGYPAMLALGYALFGAHPVVGMLLNAILGAAAAVAAWSLVHGAAEPEREDPGARRRALGAGLAVALHPVLVPYTAAIMTEGVTASLLVIAAAVAACARGAAAPAPRVAWLVATGAVMGVATLVRPQSVVLAPVLGGLAVLGPARSPSPCAPSARVRLARGALAAAVTTAVALAVCAPWTARNCARMDRCALVSVNGGWNLAIGAQTDTGGWNELVVPEACKTVFEEAAKDACFGEEARKAIVAAPLAWVARMPAKLRTTFDYFGAAPWYLHTANASRFPYAAKVVLGSVETFASRLFLAAALVAVLRLGRPEHGDDGARASTRERRRARWDRARARVRQVLVACGLVACVLWPGALAYVALALAIVALGRRSLAEVPLVVPFTAAVLLATAATHAVFFGAGRYGLVVVPFVTALAFVGPARRVVP